MVNPFFLFHLASAFRTALGINACVKVSITLGSLPKSALASLFPLIAPVNIDKALKAPSVVGNVLPAPLPNCFNALLRCSLGVPHLPETLDLVIFIILGWELFVRGVYFACLLLMAS